jgi:hypothetical protein
MIAKGSPCLDCGWSDKGPEEIQMDQLLVAEFSRRRKIHGRNYAIFMALTLGTGLVGMLTATMWFKLMYLGDIVALFWIAFLTVLTGVLSVMLTCSKTLFPIDLNCPSCAIRLDELGTIGSHCPSCNAQLK